MNATATSRFQRVTALRSLIGFMAELTPKPSLDPAPAVMPKDPAGLAKASATSAAIIARSVAALGMEPNTEGVAQENKDQELANKIWSETLLQIERVQSLYNLPPLPFQNQPIPGPPAGP